MGSIEDNASEEQYGPAILFFSAATFAKKGLWGFSTGELDSTAIVLASIL